MSVIHKIEIDFALPVELTVDEQQALDRLIGKICDRECPQGWAFWPAGCGSKPLFSQADQRFLGHPVDPKAPETGEPTWDDSVYHVECAARELSPTEVAERLAKAMQADARKARWDARLAGWLFKHGMRRASWWVADASWWAQRRMRQ